MLHYFQLLKVYVFSQLKCHLLSSSTCGLLIVHFQILLALVVLLFDIQDASLKCGLGYPLTCSQIFRCSDLLPMYRCIHRDSSLGLALGTSHNSRRSQSCHSLFCGFSFLPIWIFNQFKSIEKSIKYHFKFFIDDTTHDNKPVTALFIPEYFFTRKVGITILMCPVHTVFVSIG